MSELGIFIDESGCFDKTYTNINLKDIYIVSFLFYTKSLHIEDDIKVFENFLFENGFKNQLPIHTMPLIRKQKPYNELDRETRKRLFHHLFQFMRKLKIKHKTFVCDKKFYSTKYAIKQNLGSFIKQMVSDNYEYFNKFDEIVIYYDKGQDYLTKILHNSFANCLNNYRFKQNVCQEDYRLLQCADMVCSLELIKQRKKNNEHIKSVEDFFKSTNKFYKNYLKIYNRLEL